MPKSNEVIDDDVLALPPDLYNIQDVVSLDRLAERLAERQGRRPYRWVRFDVGPVEGAIHTEVMYLGDEPVPAVEECRADQRAAGRVSHTGRPTVNNARLNAQPSTWTNTEEGSLT